MAEPGLAVTRRAGLGMVTLRLDLAAAGAAEVPAAVGLPLPGRRRIAFAPAGAAAWMSPDELMLFGPAAGTEARLAALDAALKGRRGLAIDVSDARAVFRLDAAGARDTLARGVPVDLAPAAFGPGDLRRTRLGQVAVAFWATEDGRFELMCWRSVADHVALWLATASGGRAA